MTSPVMTKDSRWKQWVLFPVPGSIMKKMDSGSQKAVWPVAVVHTTISLAARIALFPPPAR